jgi:chromate reductase, NAD(P)H dehydrogenase (quinone)
VSLLFFKEIHMSKKFVAISGSLREDSFNTKLLKAIQKSAPSDIEIEIWDISGIPLYNTDLEEEFPSAVQALKDKVAESDGVIFATPEYNRSVPGVLKNVIDWVSRPYGHNSFTHKIGVVVGATVSPIGTAIAQSHLKTILLHLNMKVLGQPEFFVSHAPDKFDEEGNLTDTHTQDHIEHLFEVINKI